MSEEPNYKVIELEAKNESLKDELIQALKSQVEDLKKEVQYWKEYKFEEPEKDAGSHMIAPKNFRPKPIIKTVSELSTLLERKSLKLVDLPVSAEEIKDEV